MKYLFVYIFTFISVACYAQSFTQHPVSLKIAAGYAQDFPGVQGGVLQAVCNLPLNNFLEAGMGLKYAGMSGTPRAGNVKEFTRVSAIDFEMYLLPVNNKAHLVRLGIGYSFAFYNIQRSYPTLIKNSIENTTTWNMQAEKGRSRGMTLIGEYQYNLNQSLSLGGRVSLFKAYDQAFYIGPYIAVSL
jgi:hypothetical protein